jgi:hypothetical protein
VHQCGRVRKEELDAAWDSLPIDIGPLISKPDTNPLSKTFFLATIS